MTLCLKVYQKYDRSKLKVLLLLSEFRNFATESYSTSLKALRYGKDDSRGQTCGSTLNIHQDVLKSGNLQHKQGFVDSQFGTTVVCLHSHNNVTPMRKSKGHLWATYLSHMYSVRDYFTS